MSSSIKSRWVGSASDHQRCQGQHLMPAVAVLANCIISVDWMVGYIVD